MSSSALSTSLSTRCNAQCELCKASECELSAFEVTYAPADYDAGVALCSTCLTQIESGNFEPRHWRGLSESMWSSAAAVQVLSWRILNKLDGEAWAQDALDILYLDDDLKHWAEAAQQEDVVTHVDANGAALKAGDTVVITKDLDVKGSSIVAKRGTAVRNISLASNPEHIEGKVNGQRIVILTKFVKKS